MSIETPDDIFTTAELVLQSLNEVYLAHEGSVSPLPTRQLIASGAPGSQPHDCEQVSISFGQVYTGAPGNPSEGPVMCHNAPLSAVYHVEVVRSTLPGSSGPRARGKQGTSALTPEEEAEISRVQMQDARMLLYAGMRVGDDYLGSVADVGVGPESGGYQAVTLTVILGIV